jgi:hypothetical protein
MSHPPRPRVPLEQRDQDRSGYARRALLEGQCDQTTSARSSARAALGAGRARSSITTWSRLPSAIRPRSTAPARSPAGSALRSQAHSTCWEQAFTDRNGKTTVLGPLPRAGGIFTVASGINTTAEVVGSDDNSASYERVEVPERHHDRPRAQRLRRPDQRSRRDRWLGSRGRRRREPRNTSEPEQSGPGRIGLHAGQRRRHQQQRADRRPGLQPHDRPEPRLLADPGRRGEGSKRGVSEPGDDRLLEIL